MPPTIQQPPSSNGKAQWERAFDIWRYMPRPFPDTLRAWHKDGILSSEIEMKLHYIEDEFIRQAQKEREAWEAWRATWNGHKDFADVKDGIIAGIIADTAKRVAAGVATQEEKDRYHVALNAYHGMATNKEMIVKAKNVPFQNVLELHGIRLRMWKTRCMFHEERSPSFSVYRRKNTAQCFGCGWHGDTIAFVQERRQITFQEAVKYLNSI